MSKVKRNVDPVTNPFLVGVDYVTDRNADYNTMEKIQAAFQTIDIKEANKLMPEGFTGNASTLFYVNKKTRRIKVTKKWMSDLKDHVSLHAAISSSLVLYRLICMFPNPKVSFEGSNGYKVPWEMFLLHKQSGEVINMSEWKGSFGFRNRWDKNNRMNAQLKKDLIMLLELILSNNSPHPYDSTVAGSCA